MDFSNTKVLIVGDVMLDRYWWGDVGRISPETPVPVVRLSKTTLAAGGAANVAVNVAGLGAEPFLFGIVGNDDEADMVRGVLRTYGVYDEHLFSVDSRPTTVKTRVIAHSQQVARIDQETDSLLDETWESKLLEKLATVVPMADSIILADYAKGLLTDRLLTRLVAMAANAGKSILVDPKGKDYAKYRGATLITPNRREAAEACNFHENSDNMIERAGNMLINELEIDAVLITQGDAGMTLFRRNNEPRHFPAAARNVYDVTGAGDTVIATLATSLGAGGDMEKSVMLANAAAGLVVEKVGTSSISLPELTLAMNDL